MKSINLKLAVIFLCIFYSCNSEPDINEEKVAVSSKIFSYDTLQFDVSKPEGFKRIRMLDKDSNLVKVWITKWADDGSVLKSYSEYSAGKLLFEIDSTFNNENGLVKLRRKIGKSVEYEEYRFNNSGNIMYKELGLITGGGFRIYQRKLETDWHYYLIIDGIPPVKTDISPQEYIEAENLFRKRLLEEELPVRLVNFIQSDN
ncbi:MAG: hypothetical protein Kow0098_03180 [Ignavibacteriaceae bacterium]